MSAIIFDLDDTLHRERRWIMSGFSALACHLERSYELDARDVFKRLVGSLRAGHRHAALQALCADLDLPEDSIPNWVAIIRLHEPRLRLPASTVDALKDLRSTWRLAVLTNGLPAVQARKVRALGVEPLVDAVVYAGHYGGGKPEPRPFLEAAARVATHPAQCVFVGDDPWCDIYGAGAVGCERSGCGGTPTANRRRRAMPTRSSPGSTRSRKSQTDCCRRKSLVALSIRGHSVSQDQPLL